MCRKKTDFTIRSSKVNCQISLNHTTNFFYFFISNFSQGQAANTANRRVLVTDKNGKQSVQTVNDELGMNSKDVGDVKRRLDRQGVDTSAGTVEMYGGMDTRDKPSSFRRGATRTDNNSGSGKLLLLSLPFFTALYCIV